MASTSEELSKGQVTLELLLEVDNNMRREDELDARIERPKCLRTRSMRAPLRSSFKAAVHNGQIVPFTNGKKDRIAYTEEYFEEHYPIYYKACVRFSVDYGACLTGCLSAILQDPIKKNKEKRFGVYRKLAYWAGFSDWQQLLEYMEDAIRWVYPDKEYKGFQAA
jgi:hypothetical protein